MAAPSMDAFAAFASETQKQAAQQANRTNNSNNNSNFTYEDQKWVGLEQGVYHVVRLVGNPPESMTPGHKASLTDAHEIFYSEIKADDGKKFQLRLPVRGDLPEKDHLMWRIIDKVLTVQWVNKQKVYKYEKQFPDIFNKVKFGGWSETEPSEQKSRQYSKGWTGQKIVIQNVIDREDDWCKENKHTKLLARKIDTKTMPDGTVIEFPSKGIPSYGYINKLGALIANYNQSWEEFDIAIKRTGIMTEPYSIINATAFKNGKIPELPADKVPYVSVEPSLTPEESEYTRYEVGKLFAPCTYAKLDAKLGATIKMIDAAIGTNYYDQLQTLKAKEEDDRAAAEAESAAENAKAETSATVEAVPHATAAEMNSAPVSNLSFEKLDTVKESTPAPVSRTVAQVATADWSFLKGFNKLTPEQQAGVESATPGADGKKHNIVYKGNPATIPCPICATPGLSDHTVCIGCGVAFEE